MHNMLLARKILDLVKEVMDDNGIHKVLTIRITAGKLALVTPCSLRSCFAVLSAQTDLSDANLDINIVPLEYYCINCHKETLSDDGMLRCPFCGSENLILQRGHGVVVEGITVIDTGVWEPDKY